MSAPTATRQLVTVWGMDGESSDSQVPLPDVFKTPIRPDVINFVHTNMAKNARQPYAVSRKAGQQASAESWGTGRAVSRVPRVRASGTSRSGQAAFGNMCRGGRMFQPTKTWRKWHRKINLNQKRFALASAIAASSIPSVVTARGHRINEVREVPLVISNEASSIIKTKDAVALFTAMGLEDELIRCKESKKLRAGHGKWRNRRWRRRVGPIVVYDKTAGIHKAVRNLPGVESVNVDNLSLLQMAPGGHLGRLVVWTQGAFERLQALFSEELKTGYALPRSVMSNPDLSRLINSDEVQSKLRPAILRVNRMPRKKNPLKNLGVRVRLDPHFLTKQKRAEEQKKNGKARRSEKINKNRIRADMKAQRKAFHAQMSAEGDIMF